MVPQQYLVTLSRLVLNTYCSVCTCTFSFFLYWNWIYTRCFLCVFTNSCDDTTDSFIWTLVHVSLDGMLIEIEDSSTTTFFFWFSALTATTPSVRFFFDFFLMMILFFLFVPSPVEFHLFSACAKNYEENNIIFYSFLFIWVGLILFTWAMLQIWGWFTYVQLQ